MKKLDIALFSNLNKKVNYLAPGINILSTVPYNSYARFSGTSMAVPHVGGLIALLLKIYSFKQIHQITKKILKQEFLSSIHYKLFNFKKRTQNQEEVHLQVNCIDTCCRFATGTGPAPGEVNYVEYNHCGRDCGNGREYGADQL